MLDKTEVIRYHEETMKPRFSRSGTFFSSGLSVAFITGWLFVILLSSVTLFPADAAPAPSPTPLPYTPRIREVTVPPCIKLPAPPSVPADVPNRPIAAEEAARIALVHQADVAIARSNLAAAQARTKEARAPGLPSLGIGSAYSSVNAPSGSGGGGSQAFVGAGKGATYAYNGYQVNASVSQLLFDFNHTRELVRQSKELEKVAASTLSQVQSDLVLQVKSAFYSCVQNTRMVTVFEKNLDNQKVYLSLAQERFKAGVGLPSDVVRAETAVSDAVFNLTQARTNTAIARINLAVYMGIDPRTPLLFSEESEPDMETSDANALFETAFQKRPEMQQARASLAASEASLKSAHTANAPAVSGSVGWLGRDVIFPPSTGAFSTGVTLQWTPFDGGLTPGLVREAEAARASAESRFEKRSRQFSPTWPRLISTFKRPASD
jgi:outer membrane protein TolC